MRVSQAKLIAALAALALLGVGAATAPAAFASSNETVFFEAPRDLFGVSLGDPGCDLHQAAVDGRARAARRPLLGRGRALAQAQDAPPLQPGEPLRLPLGHLRPAHRRRGRAPLAGAADGDRRLRHRAALGDAPRRGPVQLSEPPGLRPVHGGRRQALRQEGQALLDLERAQPAPVPAPPVRSRQARVGDDLPQPVPRRLRRPEEVGQLLGHEGADGRDLAGRRPGGRDPGAARLPARRALPQLELPAGRALREGAGLRIRPAPIHGRRPRTVLAPLRRRRHASARSGAS